MSLLSFLSRPVAKLTASRLQRQSMNAAVLQERIFQKLIRSARKTSFGVDHHFDLIKTYEDFKSLVPVRDYEGLKSYFDQVVDGKADILWPGKPLYLSKTSGTTSGVKYIPITKQSMPNHINSARNAMLCYIAETGRSEFLDGKLIFISGSPALKEWNGLKIGRLSGIVNYHVPKYLQRNQMPSWKTNCIEDFEEKIECIVEETLKENMTMISGIPPWVQMYFDSLLKRDASCHPERSRRVKDLFPNFSLFIYGGVNFEPYRKKLEQSIGRKVDSIELYPASEGFIAFQDRHSPFEGGRGMSDLMLNVNSGIFFEFIPVDSPFEGGLRGMSASNSKHSPAPFKGGMRIPLSEVQPDVNYAIVLSSNAGLWAYSLGDTVKFTSVDPYRLIVTGRVKHFISAFGEHVIAEEVEKALMEACEKHKAHVVEFTVAPQVTPPGNEKPYHEWFIEFDSMPDDLKAFAQTLDTTMQSLNVYYRDLIQGSVLQPLKIATVRKNGFIDYMRSQGKLGGQNKVPRLSNDRKIADDLTRLNLPL